MSEILGAETPADFEARKRDHIRLAMSSQTQTRHLSDLRTYRLIHEALPSFNFSETDARCLAFSKQLQFPMFVSSMTAGHADSFLLNRMMAEACARRGWAMGVGSQRRELQDPSASREWKEIRKLCPSITFFGNIGIAQVISSSSRSIQSLVDGLEASAMIVHLNALQEVMQPEGTPDFRGGLQALERVVKDLSVPVIVKETGCGFSKSTLRRLLNIGVQIVDVAGLGGTHWGRVEGGRADDKSVQKRAAETFADWGIGTAESLLNVREIGRGSMGVNRDNLPLRAFASGGVRNGMEAAMLVAMGAELVGFAKPIMEAALLGEADLNFCFERLEFEFRTAMFCTGCQTLSELQEKNVWERIET